MNSWIDVRGASEQLYRYQMAENARPRSAVSGTFIYVRQEKKGHSIIYAGQTLNLAEGSPAFWQLAVKEHGATHLYTRLNVAAAAREAELDDLLAVETPPMNKALQESH